MTAIGGYFELELNSSGEFYSDAIKLNSGRNAFEYILKVRNYNKVYLPFFTCDAILEPIVKLDIVFEFYNIDTNFEPIFDYSKIQEDECFLYTNYFGLKDVFIKQMIQKTRQLVIDNAQAFFSKPIKNIDTFYSPRKFFGISDGSYLYCNKVLNQEFETDLSFNRMSHLLIRKDKSAEAGYSFFVENDKLLSQQPIKFMSKLTISILKSIDYKSVSKVRRENFNTLHETLGNVNKLSLHFLTTEVPMVYPFWSEDVNLRNRLLENKIYTASYWPNVKQCCKDGDLEYQFVNEIVYLPVDQRYSNYEMELIIKTILNV
ncbi:hypothetical protein [Flavobacterium sp. N2820]|uniref:hypothetical protein n=1 Tax=Flavobacterium sp. N2820 TaxID=2986834 RepID=UPI0022244BF1|nr:hypothetical protein [Flavobacterium sp. N2820]